MSEAIGFVKAVVEWVASPQGALVAWLLFTLSEAIGAIPQVSQSSVYQVIRDAIRFIYHKVKK